MKSRGEEKLFELLQEYFPGKTVVKESSFANGLRLDFYIPDLNVAFEFDGAQHEKYLDYFYKDKASFYAAQNKDDQKEYICRQLGINLIRFNYDEDLDINLLANRYEDLGPGDGIIRPGAKKYLNKKDLAKQRQKQYRKEIYKKAKEWRQKNS
jgi:very-short-patch-repair endonuclease